MRFIAIFEDKPNSADIRAEHLAAHQAYLREHKGKIVLAGAVRPEPDAPAAGGVWVFEADSKADVEALIRRDPFHIHGLRSSVRVYAWGTAPGFEDMEIGPR